MQAEVSNPKIEKRLYLDIIQHFSSLLTLSFYGHHIQLFQEASLDGLSHLLWLHLCFEIP